MCVHPPPHAHNKIISVTLNHVWTWSAQVSATAEVGCKFAWSTGRQKSYHSRSCIQSWQFSFPFKIGTMTNLLFTLKWIIWYCHRAVKTTGTTRIMASPSVLRSSSLMLDTSGLSSSLPYHNFSNFIKGGFSFINWSTAANICNPANSDCLLGGFSVWIYNHSKYLDQRAIFSEIKVKVDLRHSSVGRTEVIYIKKVLDILRETLWDAFPCLSSGALVLCEGFWSQLPASLATFPPRQSPSLTLGILQSTPLQLGEYYNSRYPTVLQGPYGCHPH